MSGNRYDVLNFFKVMFGPTWQHHMTLPPLFVARANASIGDRFTIHTNRGSTVFRLQQISDGDLALCSNEWQQFICSNNILETYVLVFTHRGDMHFDVKFYDQTAVVIETDDDQDGSEDASDDHEKDVDVIDVDDYAESEGDDDVQVVKMFRVPVSRSSGYNYRHSRLARLSLPSRAVMAYNLMNFDLAILKVPAAGKLTWPVNLRWISRFVRSGRTSPLTFALKVGWLEFANANRIRGGNICVFKMKEEVGNTVKMDVLIERRGRVR